MNQLGYYHVIDGYTIMITWMIYWKDHIIVASAVRCFVRAPGNIYRVAI